MIDTNEYTNEEVPTLAKFESQHDIHFETRITLNVVINNHKSLLRH